MATSLTGAAMLAAIPTSGKGKVRPPVGGMTDAALQAEFAELRDSYGAATAGVKAATGKRMRLIAEEVVRREQAAKSAPRKRNGNGTANS
jgi:hypothetical protein